MTARGRAAAILIPALCFLVISSGPARGQRAFTASGRLVGGLLVGQVGDFLDRGLGLEAGGAVHLDEDSILRLRADLAWMRLDDSPHPPSGEVATNTHWIFLFGPELAWPGEVIEPFAHAFGGSVWNHLGYRLSDSDRTDHAFVWGGGGGLRLNLQDSPLTFEVAGRVWDTGRLDYARAPDPDDDVIAGWIETDVGILGVTVGARYRLR